MPFGLRNAGQSFQRFMDEVLAGLDFAFCFLDDILIASSTEDELLQHLQQVLQQLRQSMERFVPPAVRPVPAAEPSKMEADLQQASLYTSGEEHHLQASLPCTRGHTRSC